MMNRTPGNDENDSSWQLLRSAKQVTARPSFADEVVSRVAREPQEPRAPHELESKRVRELSGSDNVWRLIKFAPASYQVAAAAIVVLTLTLVGISVFSPSDQSENDAGNGGSFAEDVVPNAPDWADVDDVTTGEDDSALAPFEDTFAVEEIDSVLGIEDPEALEDEDLLLLLLPVPELL